MQLNFKSKVNRNDKINFMTFILFLKFSFNLCNNKYKNFISLKLIRNISGWKKCDNKRIVMYGGPQWPCAYKRKVASN